MNFRHFFALCLLWSTTLSLLGCGGAPDSANANAGNGGGGSTASPVQAGVYYDGSSGHDFWGVITPGNRWYGLNYATANPDVYSGDLSGTGTLQATIPTPGMNYQNTADTVLNGAASMTSAGSGKLAGNLSLITTPSITPVSFNATTPTGYNYNQAAALSAIAGSWTGQLSFGSGSSANFVITIAATDGSVTARASDGSEEFGHCKWITSTSNFVAHSQFNFFALTLHMAPSTGCDTDLNDKTLTGMAFVTPGANNLQRLIWVATTSDGHAIAYKAER